MSAAKQHVSQQRQLFRRLLAPIAVAVVALDYSKAQERMYATIHPGLQELDAQSGAPLGWDWPGPPHVGVQRNFASSNGRLVGIGGLLGSGCVTQLQVISINPADASPIGSDCVLGAYVHQVDGDSATGVLYSILAQQLYTMDPVTGQMAYIVDVTGAQAGTTCFAIRHDGVALRLVRDGSCGRLTSAMEC